jgi:serine/threonine protein kinase
MRYLTMRHEFPSLSADNSIAQGSSGGVFAITARIVFKCPNLYVDDGLLTRGDKYEMEQSIKSVKNEKTIYGILQSHPHPNILYAILCVAEGIFMPRLETTLAIRIAIPCITDLESQERWINQLVSAAAWPEKLGYAHGDLRPENILVDKLNDIKIADFDATVPIGSELLLATLPFCKVDEDFETPLAGAETEQSSLGSCIYNIRFGVPPYSDLGLESPVWRKMLTQKDYPSTDGDRYGDVIQDCWKGRFPSIGALQIEIDRLTTVHVSPRSKPARHHDWYLLAQCHEYVAGQRLRIRGSIAWRLRLRCRLIVWSVIRATLGVFYDGD